MTRSRTRFENQKKNFFSPTRGPNPTLLVWNINYLCLLLVISYKSAAALCQL